MDIESARMKYENQLMQMPNVTGIGIGKKGDKEVIKVFVTRKLPESMLQPYEIILKTIEGYETDVEEIGVVVCQV